VLEVVKNTPHAKTPKKSPLLAPLDCINYLDSETDDIFEQATSIPRPRMGLGCAEWTFR
jgi:hypothetical protein